MASLSTSEHGKDDATFMAACMACYDNDLNKIDLTAVAKQLGKNAKSVESKFYALKKKHGFTIKVTFNKAQPQHGGGPSKVTKPKRTPTKTTSMTKSKTKTSPGSMKGLEGMESDTSGGLMDSTERPKLTPALEDPFEAA
ncbi:hypothetical protein N7468_004016 [Penicillium chermesinum]|uniref:Uncharacterized protein n=1 Tax=Penicillium chermesinum TaxID=63820 RepID=A0A9W9PAG1_9EURO|nr:uncharacterized protein N7468_004016 [Penicillium chermesinum]KAJ5239397.1 hypothetical protein N7468_004016 [Penicillium chermesinum]KAJ6141344.1 hypothetical protein N7470_010240 [Penicillium chermesinum]